MTSAVAELNTVTNSDYIHVQSYTVAGVDRLVIRQLRPTCPSMRPGATDLIIDQEPNRPTMTTHRTPCSSRPTMGSGTGLSLAWNETVTDSNGTHDQVEFAIVRDADGGVAARNPDRRQRSPKDRL